MSSASQAVFLKHIALTNLSLCWSVNSLKAAQQDCHWAGARLGVAVSFLLRVVSMFLGDPDSGTARAALQLRQVAAAALLFNCLLLALVGCNQVTALF